MEETTRHKHAGPSLNMGAYIRKRRIMFYFYFFSTGRGTGQKTESDILGLGGEP